MSVGGVSLEDWFVEFKEMITARLRPFGDRKHFFYCVSEP